MKHIADVACHLNASTQEITTVLERPRPWKDCICESEECVRLKPHPAALLEQFTADQGDAVPCLVVAEPRAGESAEPDIGAGRRVAVATLDDEIDRATADQGVEIGIKHVGWAPECHQDTQGGEECRVTRYWQLNQILNRTGSELGPDPLVFTSHFLVAGMR